MNKYFIIILFFSVSFCTACKKSIEPSAFVNWVKDTENGLTKSKEIGGLKMIATYHPPEYMVINRFKSNDIDREAYEAKLKEYKNITQFELKLAVTERKGVDVVNWRVANQQQSQQRLNYLSFDMRDHIYLVNGRDTLPCLSYHFERSYDVAPHRTFLVSFDTKGSQEDKTIILDSPVFQTGPMKIKFKQQQISNLPNIKLKS